jgi:hypothetical protein
MKTEHHGIMLLIAQSLHSRLQALESLHMPDSHGPRAALGIGFDDVSNFLDNAEDALLKIHNIEKTVETYLDHFERIRLLCTAPNPNFYEIFMSILELIEGEDAMKARRDEQLIVAIKANLLTLETIEELHGNEIVSLGSNFIGFNPFDVIDDTKKAVKAIIDIKKTVKDISAKFELIKQEISDFQQSGQMWDVFTVLGLVINIIKIIEEEDTAKVQRDKELLNLITRITTSFEMVTIKLHDFKPAQNLYKNPYRRTRKESDFQNQGAVDYWNASPVTRRAAPRNAGSAADYYTSDAPRSGGGAADYYTFQRPPSYTPFLNSPISQVLSAVRQVGEAIQALRDIEETITNMIQRYHSVARKLGQIDFHGNPREIIPYLIELIGLIKGDEKIKIERDIRLVDNMKKITIKLKEVGYHIV